MQIFEMKKLFFFLYLGFSIFGWGQSLTGVPLNSLLPQEYNFTIITEAYLVTNNDTLHKWTFDMQNNAYKKYTLNTIDYVKYSPDSNELVTAIFEFGVLKEQIRYISYNNSQDFRSEKIQFIQGKLIYESSVRIGDSVQSLTYNKANKEWVLTFSVAQQVKSVIRSSDKGKNFRDIEINEEDKIIYRVNPFYRDYGLKYYNSTKLCVIEDKACVVPQKTKNYFDKDVVSHLASSPLGYEEVMYIHVAGRRVNQVFNVGNNSTLQSITDKLCEFKGESKIYLVHFNDDVKVEPCDLIAPFVINTSYKSK